MSFSREGLGSAVEMDKPGVAFVDGVENPHSLTILGNTILPDARGKRAVPAHLVVARYGNVYRFLKRGHLLLPSATNAPNLTLNLPVNIFTTGDALKVVEPTAAITFALAWAADDTVTVTIAGTAFTFPAGDTVLANIAANAATAINNHPQLSQLVRAIASSAQTVLFANDGISTYSFTSGEATASTGTATASGSSFAPNNTTVGTISSINVTSGVVTLSGNAGVALPTGANVGVPENEMLGVYPHSLDLTNRERYNLSPVSGCQGYYQQSMPHFDEDIRRKLDRIYFATKF